MTMTEDQAQRIARLKENRAAPKRHKAHKSRAFVLGVSVAAVSGLVSGMWATEAVAEAEPITGTALQPVVVPGAAGQPDQIVYLVVTRPATTSGADSLRANPVPSSQPQLEVPAQPVSPAQISPARTPVTRSHGSR